MDNESVGDVMPFACKFIIYALRRISLDIKSRSTRLTLALLHGGKISNALDEKIDLCNNRLQCQKMSSLAVCLRKRYR